ncbi:MAG: stage III sporulation AC/AD family protein [Oscillospiraceae bacterium]|nr:stage III sporulation AC/AD family protein [Oscillospiraceae bacterium]
MEEVFRAAAVAVIAALLALLAGRHIPELGLLLAVLAAVLLASMALGQTRELLDTARNLQASTGLSGEIITPLLRTVGIGIVTRIAAELCRDAREGGIAAAVELAGTVAALCTALPLVQLVLRTVQSLL